MSHEASVAQSPWLMPIAAAPQAASVAQDGEPSTLMAYACVTCTRRKVKCDRSSPCSTCRKARVECHYQEPPRRKRKRKPVEDLQDKLDRYEKLLIQHGILPNDSPVADTTTPTGNAPSTISSPKDVQPAVTKSTGTLIRGPGKTRYVDSNIWRNLGEDLHPSSDEDDRDDEISYGAAAKPDLQDPASFAFFGASTPKQDLLNLHPTYDIAIKLWKLYVRNADPVVRIIHLPTGLEMVQRAAANPSAMSKVTEALLFAICFFATISTPEDEFEREFRQPSQSQAYLQDRYHLATRQALVACQFMKTTELAVLQAYVIFLLAVRPRYDPHTFWIQTGIAVRLGQRMGLHRDGEALGLNPFDVELRRRLFWQLLPLDGIAGQLSGTGIAIKPDDWDTKQPLNIEDEDIWQGMESQPVERKGATAMIFCLARTEIGKFHQKLRPAVGNWAQLWEPGQAAELPSILEALEELETTMEEKYIRYCDISIPAHCLTLTMARGVLHAARLRIALPRAKLPGTTPAERKDLCGKAIKALNADAAVASNPNLSCFRWHFKSFFMWDPLIWLLNEIQRDDTIVDVEEVWAKTEQCYSTHPELLDWKRPFDIALARIIVRSWDATHSADDVELPLIATLRAAFRRREAARQPAQPPAESQSNLAFSAYLPMEHVYTSYGMLDDINIDWDQLMQPQPLPIQ
ncbi:related to C6 transcription factor [Ramularia collo-cygni]|uniref:Related to C6 transcription factor n=1 Tax=Ramularia collo-cygni TaxID=112498 RepID=A0A2D3VMQ7_9PEZI|nr:related to C6 transcription factor [Ramularia collo-cygni]CZT24084.1 related to C6 transcription factor [Ramularia collo-cygni]